MTATEILPNVTDEIRAAYNALLVAQGRSDRAFAKVVAGTVKTNAAAVRLARQVEELQGEFDHLVYASTTLQCDASDVYNALVAEDEARRDAIVARLDPPSQADLREAVDNLADLTGEPAAAIAARCERPDDLPEDADLTPVAILRTDAIDAAGALLMAASVQRRQIRGKLRRDAAGRAYAAMLADQFEAAAKRIQAAADAAV